MFTPTGYLVAHFHWPWDRPNFSCFSWCYIPTEQEGCRVKSNLQASNLVSAESIFTGVVLKKNSIPFHTLFTVWFQETAPSWWKVPAIMHPEVLGFKLFQWTRCVLLREVYSPGRSLPSARIQRTDLFIFFFWIELDRVFVRKEYLGTDRTENGINASCMLTFQLAYILLLRAGISGMWSPRCQRG